MSTQTDKTKK